MMNKKTWGLICLAVSVFMSCRDGQNTKSDAKVDSLVTRTRGEVWGFMNPGLYPSQQEIKFLTKQIYPIGPSNKQQAPNQQWQSLLSAAKRNGRQIYLSEGFDQAAVKAIINNEKQQTTTINALIGSIKERSASGLVVNFGLIQPADAPRYLKFIKKLADQFHSKKLTLAIVTPPVNLFLEKDIVALSEASDYVLFDFSNVYGDDGADTMDNPYASGQSGIVGIMTRILYSPIALRKVMMILPSHDLNFANHCEFALRANLAGVAVIYSGKKSDQGLTDTLRAKFQYVDTVRLKQ